MPQEQGRKISENFVSENPLSDVVASNPEEEVKFIRPWL
jgi:hypothetical protein